MSTGQHFSTEAQVACVTIIISFLPRSNLVLHHPLPPKTDEMDTRSINKCEIQRPERENCDDEVLLTILPVPPRYDSLLSTVSIDPLAGFSPTSTTTTATWQSQYLPDPDPDPMNLSGPRLFDHVHKKFQVGISTLDNLLRFMEASGPAQCKAYKRGIDSLLGSLVYMARWLVGFFESPKGREQPDAPWTKSAMHGLRVDLHKYSSKVMRITLLLRKPGAFRGKGHSV